jgi:hypothetical protein
MSRLGARHVQEMPLESDLDDGYAWLTREKAERPDMFGLEGGHVQGMLLESGLGARYVLLTREKSKRPDMSGQSLWNLARGRICLA